jgi:hypothetical protein
MIAEVLSSQEVVAGRWRPQKVNHKSKLSPEDQAKLRAIRERSQDEWAERISALPLSIRPFAARVVWWDWFANQTVAERWPHLDQYLKFTTESAEFAPLALALEALGYPEATALKRAS